MSLIAFAAPEVVPKGGGGGGFGGKGAVGGNVTGAGHVKVGFTDGSRVPIGGILVPFFSSRTLWI